MAAVVSFKPVERMDEDELMQAMADPMWRLNNLYWIKTKDEDEDDDSSEGVVVKFRPNRAQRALLSRMWYRNLILKARQLGFTTLIQVLFLDYALFTPNMNIGVIAHTDDAAKKIFKKIKFAYERLPKVLRDSLPLLSCSVREMTIANGSTITVGTSMRGDTIHYLHISEYGKICAKFPDRAEEVITGTLPAVPKTGVVFIESTAEGAEGDFHKKSIRAEQLHLSGVALNERQYRFHFFSWHEEEAYQMDPTGVIISQKEHAYFDAVEVDTGTTISLRQRAWWISTRDEEFGGADERMWQEYPSSPKEAFQKSTEGTYYKMQIIAARKQGRITTVPYTPGIPVDTFWDIGHGDGTGVWFRQRVGQRHHFIKYIEGWGEPYSHFVSEMHKTGWVFGSCYLPHDGAHVRMGQEVNLSPQQMLENLQVRNIHIVPRVAELQHGIQATRDYFGLCWFDEAGCKEGIEHLSMYRKTWNTTTQNFTELPFKDVHTEGADSFRQAAQVGEGTQAQSMGEVRKQSRRSWRTS